MAAWLPLLKAALPYVTDVVTAALPAFTQNRNKKATDLIDQQITELQQSVTHNAESVKVLAEQLQKTIIAVDNGASALEQTTEQIKQTQADQSQIIMHKEEMNLRIEKQLLHIRNWAIAATLFALFALMTVAVALLR